MMKKLTLTLTMALALSACSQSTTPLQGELAVFNWLQQANPQQDSQTAIAQQDYRLIAISGRGQALPGIDGNTANKAKLRCKTKFVQGLGDNKGQGEYKIWWQKAFDYAQQYNRAMINYCVN